MESLINVVAVDHRIGPATNVYAPGLVKISKCVIWYDKMQIIILFIPSVTSEAGGQSPGSCVDLRRHL